MNYVQGKYLYLEYLWYKWGALFTRQKQLMGAINPLIAAERRDMSRSKTEGTTRFVKRALICRSGEKYAASESNNDNSFTQCRKTIYFFMEN